MKYRVTLRAVVERTETVEASSARHAAQQAEELTYDSVDEVPRGAWGVDDVTLLPPASRPAHDGDEPIALFGPGAAS